MVNPANLAPTDLITLEEVIAKVGMQKSFIYSEEAAGRFPKRIKRGTRTLWVRGEIDDYNSAAIAARNMGRGMGQKQVA